MKSIKSYIREKLPKSWKENARRAYLITLATISKKNFVGLSYKRHTHKNMNWENPEDLNQKIQWLKVYGDTSQWPKLADKYLVREFIKEKGYEDILIPLLGVWNDAREIDFSKLPNKFVLKPNNGSADVIIVKDKSNLDIQEVIKKLNWSMKHRFGLENAEPHYFKIKPLIVAEELLEQNDNLSEESLIDYKVWCFNGTPNCVCVYCNRKGGQVQKSTYDLNWQCHPEMAVVNFHSQPGREDIPRPKNFEKMLEIAKVLSQGFPEVRVDFYNIDGKIYFGEMTFTGAGGFIDFYTEDALVKLGKLVILPKEKK